MTAPRFEPLGALWDDPALSGPTLWTVDKLIPADGLTMLYGIGKVGKSSLAAQLAVAVANGTQFLGRATEAGPVIWLNLERSRKQMFSRFKTVSRDTRPRFHPILTFTGLWPDKAIATLESVLTTVKTIPPKLVVVDSLSPFLQLEDENDNAEITRRLAPLAAVAHGLGIAILVLFHDRKSEGAKGRAIRGGGAFLAVVDAAFHMRYDHDGSTNNRRLECVGNYDELPAALNLRYEAGVHVVDEETRRAWLDKVLLALPEAGNGTAEGMLVSKIVERTGSDKKTVQRALAKLREEGSVSREDGAGRHGDRWWRAGPVVVGQLPLNRVAVNVPQKESA